MSELPKDAGRRVVQRLMQSKPALLRLIGGDLDALEREVLRDLERWGEDAPQPMHADGSPADPARYGTFTVDSAVAPGVLPVPSGGPDSDLYARLHSLSKAMESSGRIDEHEHPDAYGAILDAMLFVAGAPQPPAAELQRLADFLAAHPLLWPAMSGSPVDVATAVISRLMLVERRLRACLEASQSWLYPGVNSEGQAERRRLNEAFLRETSR